MINQLLPIDAYLHGDYSFLPISHPIRWDGEVHREGWLIYCNRDVVTVCTADENPWSVLTDLISNEPQPIQD